MEVDLQKLNNQICIVLLVNSNVFDLTDQLEVGMEQTHGLILNT